MEKSIIHIGLNPNYEMPIIAIKITPNCYVNDFVNNGIIHFSSPSDWRDSSKCSGKQLDIYEGSFLKTIDKNDVNSINRVSDYFLVEEIDSITFVDNDPNVYGCCFYTIRKSDFEGPFKSVTGTTQEMYKVSGEYFGDFKKSQSKEEYLNTSIEERDKVVLIFDFWQIIEKIKKTLIDHGCSENEIFMGPVFYQTKQNPYFINMSHPLEYFLKDSFFQKQNEFRIIINSNNAMFNSWLKDNKFNISVGDISKICSIQDYYFKGLSMAIEGNHLLFELATPDVIPLENLCSDALMTIILQTNSNSLPQGKMNSEELSNALDLLEAILKKKYGLLFDRKENQFIKLE